MSKKHVSVQVETEIEGKEATSLGDSTDTSFSDSEIQKMVQDHINEWAREHHFDDVYVSNISVVTADKAREKALQVKLRDLLSD
jgi:hypothetical protein